jgi:ferredoxin-NADP reductase/MOSC domain-containing protein YiiM
MSTKQPKFLLTDAHDGQHRAVGSIVSVNVGRPQEVVWKGKTVHTAIWKAPVHGRVRVTRLNVEGDAQADLQAHGGEQRAIMVYQMDSYRFWSETLKRADLAPGQFGENLTVEGLADADVCIGDRYKIGSAIVEVTQPRVTCFKIGIRLGVPALPALLVKHQRPGFYLRVLQEGDIGAGDTIEKLAVGPGAMSIVEIDQLLYSANHPLPALRRAARIPALSPGWQRSFESLIADRHRRSNTGNSGLTGRTHSIRAPFWRGFAPLTVLETQIEATAIRSLVIGAPDGHPLPDALPGQHILIRITSADGNSVIRNYSLCGAPGQGVYRIGVKREQNGLVSTHLHENVRPGQTLDVGAPRGDFILKMDERPMVLVSAGIGITPMLSMLHALTAQSVRLPSDVWWIHSARDGAHHAFRDEQIAALKHLPQNRVFTLYSRPRPDLDRIQTDYSHTGHIDTAFLQHAQLPLDANYYLCGPTSLLAKIVATLERLGIPPAQIHQEIFGAMADSPQRVPHLPEGPSGSGPAVTFVRSAITVNWDKRFGTLLELAEACDIPVSWACRTGVCHRCESELLEGEPYYEIEPIDLPPPGKTLICCTRPVTPIILDL